MNKIKDIIGRWNTLYEYEFLESQPTNTNDVHVVTGLFSKPSIKQPVQKIKYVLQQKHKY